MRIFGTVYAHCDVPCGIYETDTMTHAADTCKVMVEKALALGELDDLEHQNQFIRIVTTKEKHAERVKHEVAVLWGDYFKPEHLEKYPDLHEKVWSTLKQASKVKQTMDLEVCVTLQQKVAELAEIFADSKK
jgi:nickel superoxide dismutase